jgi:hypothetical protein
MPGIVNQADQYGLPEREASVELPPSEVFADLLSGYHTRVGLMSTKGKAES